MSMHVWSCLQTSHTVNTIRLTHDVRFWHGFARDGTPVLYFRHARYDRTKATPEQFVLAAAYCMVPNYIAPADRDTVSINSILCVCFDGRTTL